MKNKVKLTFLLLFISMHLMAPPSFPKSMYILTSQAVYNPNWIDYGPLADAVYIKESSCNPFAYNPREQAFGGFQIRQCKLNDYNLAEGTNYRLEDCFNYNLSRRIFLYFAEKEGNFEKAAKRWNGSGPMVIDYWEDVKKLL
jgi:hypothetical protein